ncbi:unnamed protein product [Somion occarium]|uniref:Protein kinase domain-containing protein n=2 Tax=Somion occarium TaxID=3059160 RepID=A0ABP1DMW0_9APHY
MGRSERTMTSLLGRHIDNGRLRLTQILGSGSSGVVYLATANSSNARYAVKCMTKAEPESAAHTMQQREIQHHRHVSSHPNVLTLHRVVDEEPYIFLVLDYCPGGDLFKFISEGGTFTGDDAEVKRVFLQLVDAVEHCHKNGVFHRDIKPENILCSGDRSHVYLGDFGLSTMSAYSANFCVGSYSYMSPECLHFDKLSDLYSCRRNDIWALGVILTSMISGRNPWRYATEADGCWHAFQENPEFLRTMLPISEGANTILRSIFTTTERDRISLAALRQRIMHLDTFFMSAGEISRAGHQVRTVAASYFRAGSPHLAFRGSSSSYGEELTPRDERRRLHFGSAQKEEAAASGGTGSSSEVQYNPRSHPTNPINAEELSNPDSQGPRTPTPVETPTRRLDRCIPGVGACCGRSSPDFSPMTKNVDGRTSYPTRMFKFKRIVAQLFD